MFSKKILTAIFVSLLIVGCGAGNQPLPTNSSSSTDGGSGGSGGAGGSGGSGGSGGEAATGVATLSWDVPATNTDGTPLTDLAGFKVYFGTSSGNYTTVINVGNVTAYVVSNLASGTYYFTVTSYSFPGYESDFSNEGSIVIL